MHIRQQVGIGFRFEESGKRSDLFFGEAIMRHRRIVIVIGRITQPGFDPLRFCFRSDLGELGPNIAPDDVSIRHLHRVT